MSVMATAAPIVLELGLALGKAILRAIDKGDTSTLEALRGVLTEPAERHQLELAVKLAQDRKAELELPPGPPRLTRKASTP